jgi:dolichol kinase
VQSIYPIFVSIFYIFNGIIQLLISLKLHKKFKEHSFATSISTVILWFFAAIAYPFLILKANGSIENYTFHSFFWIVLFTPFVIFCILFYQFLLLKRKPELRETRKPENLERKLASQGNVGDSYDFYVDLKRKVLHLIPALLIIGLYYFGIWIKNIPMSFYLIITVGYAGIFAFAMLDLLRFSWLFGTTKYYELLPSKIFTTLTETMKPRELVEFIKSAAMILAMIPILFFDFGIFVSTALISTIGDGCASVFGKAWGKKNWPKNSPKTIVGYISGILASCSLSLFSLLVFQPGYSSIKIILLCIASGVIFFIVDVSNSRIDDNILNSIVIGFSLGFLSIILV